MTDTCEYKGYKISVYTRRTNPPLEGFLPFGTISKPGDTRQLNISPEIYGTKEEADNAFVNLAKKYIDDYLD